MGLTIRCYTNLKEISESEVEGLDEKGIDFFHCKNHEEYLDRIKNIKNNTYYTGKYYGTDVNYAYSYHYKFRIELLKLSNNLKCLKIPTQEDKYMDRYEFDILFNSMLPEDDFYELVFFSDCDGFLDWETCGVILDDFKKYEDIVNKFPEVSYGTFKEQFNNWISTLEFCNKNKGVLMFS